MANRTQQLGPVQLEANAEGLWAWINDAEGTCLCEIDCGLRLSDVPSELHEAVRAAYEWAVNENRTRQGDDEQLSTDEVGEWRWIYNQGRFR